MQGPRHLSPDSGRLSVAAAALGLAAAIITCGCQSTHVVTADAAGRVHYESLRVTYELTEPTIRPISQSEPLTLEDARSRPLRAFLTSRQSSGMDSGMGADLRLTIQAPHPDGDTGMGLVTLSAPGSEPGEWEPVSRQSVCRADVDLLLVHLVNGGVCDDGVHPNGGARIAVELDGHLVHKPWNREPRLDRLAVETYDAR